MRNYKVLGFGLAGLFLLMAQVVSAHVVVKPNSVGIGAFQVFTMGVPSEKSVATVSLRLLLPEGLNFVTPNVKPGWKVEVKTQATGRKITDDDGMMVDEMKPVEIDWTGGSVPAGQRDEFSFQAQVPAAATTLAWKVYQTYADGSVVAWDQTPSNDAKNPYSKTQVIDDLSARTEAQESWWIKNGTKFTAILSIVAIILAGYAVMKNKTV
ncbi:MAG: YcnI family protein [Candidatus Doudnabacteria bacterium]